MNRTKLDRNWQISLNGETKDVRIPHDFMIGLTRRADSASGIDEGYFETGCARYTTTFAADPSAAHHFLSFDGVMGLTEVYVNDNLVKFHPYGYTSFLCDVQPYLRETNELCVIADTTHQVSSRWYTGGGIYRDVHLLTSGEDYIVPDSVFVKTKSLRGSSASVAVEWQIFSSKAREAKAVIEIPELGVRMERWIWLESGVSDFSVQTMLDGITPWTPEQPQLYNVTVTVITDASEDSDTSTFGIRTVECDPVRGLLLNGEVTRLYGACIHHDNGIVGAASFRSAEERRIRILKENGFNAIRCAHNPPSAVMLDACDRMGMLVIDEIFDAWRLPKKNFDYHIWFDKYWEEDTDAMVLRDRRHPSVILWSTGNEIPDKSGRSDGWRTSRMIADRIRRNDDTRPLTHAFCTFWDHWPYEVKRRETEHLPAEEFDFFAERIRCTAGTLDVLGYNYLLDRTDKDMIRFPDRLFAMTESFPVDAVAMKKYMDRNPRMIGEFVWTGWDYFGETGLGRIEYREDTATMWGLSGFPEHHANCGDMDICGFRKAQSYYRDAAWKTGCVRILSADPDTLGKSYAMSAWGFYNTDRTWTYPGREGKMTAVHVYTTADECELWLNGVSCGRKVPSEKGIAVFEIPYQPGRLTAAAYSGTDITGEDALSTTGDAVSMRIRASDRDDLIYAEIELTDENGLAAWTAENEVTVTAENGTVIGTGSGKNVTDHIYTSNVCCAEHGKLLAAILPDDGAQRVVITAVSGEMSASVTVD